MTPERIAEIEVFYTNIDYSGSRFAQQCGLELIAALRERDDALDARDAQIERMREGIALLEAPLKDIVKAERERVLGIIEKEFASADHLEDTIQRIREEGGK